MNITEIRVKLIRSKSDKLRGFASVTIDNLLVIRDLKIIDGPGGLFVAMPSRKLCDRCPQCAGKNHLRARHCNDCGARLRESRGEFDERGRPRLYADIAHPIHQDGRGFIQGAVIKAFQEESERAQQEGYVGHSFEDLDYEAYDEPEGHAHHA